MGLGVREAVGEAVPVLVLEGVTGFARPGVAEGVWEPVAVAVGHRAAPGYKLWGQGRQLLSEDAPTCALNVKAGHGVDGAMNPPAQKLPAGHAAHVTDGPPVPPEAGKYWPRKQIGQAGDPGGAPMHGWHAASETLPVLLTKVFCGGVGGGGWGGEGGVCV